MLIHGHRDGNLEGSLIQWVLSQILFTSKAFTPVE